MTGSNAIALASEPPATLVVVVVGSVVPVPGSIGAVAGTVDGTSVDGAVDPSGPGSGGAASISSCRAAYACTGGTTESLSGVTPRSSTTAAAAATTATATRPSEDPRRSR